MSSHASFALALVACLVGWVAAIGLVVCYGVGMAKLKLAAAAGVGALLPFVPDLVQYLALPPAVSNALCAVVLAVAYSLVPKDTK